MCNSSPVPAVLLTDLTKVPQMIEIGRQAALDAWPQIALLLQSFAKRRSRVVPHLR